MFRQVKLNSNNVFILYLALSDIWSGCREEGSQGYLRITYGGYLLSARYRQQRHLQQRQQCVKVRDVLPLAYCYFYDVCYS